MALSEAHVKWQTREIIKYLFEDVGDVACRSGDDLETDGAAESNGEFGFSSDSEDKFDAVLVADRLRNIADELDSCVSVKAALSDLKQAVAQEASEKVFSAGVEALRQTQLYQSDEVAPEMQLIKASVALGLYFIKSAPDLNAKVQDALNAFFDRNLLTWLTQLGGWDNVNI